MTGQNILDELRKLTNTERLSVIEAALEMIRSDLQQLEIESLSDRKKQLSTAAELLLSDYISDKELTAFTTLDGEDFHV